jgi:hypothetical protein
MTTLPPGIPFSQDAPVNPAKHATVTVAVDCVRNPEAEDSQQEWQTRLRSLEQWICELLIKNQQLRWALMEIEQLKSMSNTKWQP